MPKIILSFLISLIASAQPQSLNEYNRVLLKSIIEQKTLTPKDQKALRIRLGTEISSADDIFYKGGELMKLLVYTTFGSYQNKLPGESQLIKNSWSKLTNLPNPAKTTISNDHLSEIFQALGNDNRQFIQFLDFAIQFIPDSKNKIFLPIIDRKCDELNFLRDLEALQNCWKIYEDYIGSDVGALVELKTEQLYSYLHTYKNDEFNKLADQILANETLANTALKRIIIRNRIHQRILEGKLTGIEEQLEELKKTSTNTDEINRILVRYYLVKNKPDQAVKTFKMITEKAQNAQGLEVYYKIAIELYVTKGELPSARFYGQKLIELERTEKFDEMISYISNVLMDELLKKPVKVEDVKAQMEIYEKLIQSQLVKDPLTNHLLSFGKLLTQKSTGIKSQEYNAIADEIIKIFTPRHYMSQLIKKYGALVAEKQP